MRGNKTIARILCVPRPDGGSGRYCAALARTGVRGRNAMRVRHARQAVAASLWLLALAAQSAADPKTSSDDKTAARGEANACETARGADETDAKATPEARSHDSPEAESPTALIDEKSASSPSWDTFDAGPKLELTMAPGIDWSAVDTRQGAEHRGNMLRAIGYVVGGLGVVGLATGGVFGYRAFDFNQRALDQCRAVDPSACTGDGKDSRDQAKAFAGGAIVTLAAGAALLVSGIALIVHAPHSAPSRMPLVSDLRLSAVPNLKGANFRLVGAW